MTQWTEQQLRQQPLLSRSATVRSAHCAQYRAPCICESPSKRRAGATRSRWQQHSGRASSGQSARPDQYALTDSIDRLHNAIPQPRHRPQPRQRVQATTRAPSTVMAGLHAGVAVSLCPLTPPGWIRRHHRHLAEKGVDVRPREAVLIHLRSWHPQCTYCERLQSTAMSCSSQPTAFPSLVGGYTSVLLLRASLQGAAFGINFAVSSWAPCRWPSVAT